MIMDIKPEKISTLPLAVTMGDPAGVGPELALRAFAERETKNIPPFVLLADVGHMRALAASSVQCVEILENNWGAVPDIFQHALPVRHHPLSQHVIMGQPHAAHAPAILKSIEAAVQLVQRGLCRAVVTNPIHKASLYQAGFSFPGHTEYLAHLAGGGADPVMMLAVEGLRVVPLTIHVPLSDVPKKITQEKIISTARTVLQALQKQFFIQTPRLAVAGLNPHAGEEGTIGHEDKEAIAPAVAALTREGWQVSGPHPADSLFHADARKHYDAVLCMYHDQALIPLKTIDFWGGVNITLGLPFVRTSPDHGTAFDIAGQGKARTESFLAALRTAHAMTS